ncbi:hypothetical protein [Oleiharenicola sp. Vm1]|uniref:hypothetical protein n=1 Tax=Oleiharenicola sp. Vm1 TaxID=3398393 RepID=UPI0039F63250
MKLLTCCSLALTLAAPFVRAEDPAAAAPAAEPAKVQKATDDDLRIQGIFNSALPGTERKSSLRLIVHPHLGDLTKRDEIRTALGLRYGLTARWEATAETDAYFTHGLKNGTFGEESGFASIHLGTKYRLGDPFHLGIDTSVGLDWSRPLGTPPPDVTDGLKHLSPYFTMSRALPSHPGWRVFWGLGYDDVTQTDVVGRLEKNDLRADSLGFSGGVLWERGPTTYTLETIYQTTQLTSSSDRYVVGIRPGVVWTLPPKYTFHAKGKWLLGVGLRLTHGPDGNDVGLNAKLRVNFDFKRLLGRKKDPASGQ